MGVGPRPQTPPSRVPVRDDEVAGPTVRVGPEDEARRTAATRGRRSPPSCPVVAVPLCLADIDVGDHQSFRTVGSATKCGNQGVVVVAIGAGRVVEVFRHDDVIRVELVAGSEVVPGIGGLAARSAGGDAAARRLGRAPHPSKLERGSLRGPPVGLPAPGGAVPSVQSGLLVCALY